MTKQFRVAVDFDGTIVEHRFPEIGEEAPHAFEWMKKWKEAGALLILWTMRSADRQVDGDVLAPAVEFCRQRGLEFDGVNEGPGDRNWTNSPKVYAHRYVDDAAVGCPLICGGSGRPTVDWSIVGPEVLKLIENYNKENSNGK